MQYRSKFWNEQKLWYAKLKREGFEDIEWQGGHSTHSLNSDYLKNPALRYKSRYNDATAQHYRLMRSYASHASFDRKIDKFAFDLYCEGITFRDIIQKVYRAGWNQYLRKTPKRKKARYTSALSLFTLHHLLKKYIKRAYEWHRVSPDGLLNPEAEDPVSEIAELFNEECKPRS